MKYFIRVLQLLAFLSINTTAIAQSEITPEERFQDLFVTAGYSTAFGTAIGAAIVGLSKNPTGNLRYLAVGASIGFISGSAMGAYFVFSPLFSNEAHLGQNSISPAFPENTIRLTPIISKDAHNFISGFQADWLIAKF